MHADREARRPVVGEHPLPRRVLSQRRGRRGRVERQRELAVPPPAARARSARAARSRAPRGAPVPAARTSRTRPRQRAPRAAAGRARFAARARAPLRTDRAAPRSATTASASSLAERAHVREPDPHRVPLERAARGAQVHVRRPHLHPAPLRVPHERGGRVEAHRLRVQERAQELGRIVVPQPRRLVGEQPERGRMRLREAEAGKADELVEDRRSRPSVHALRARPRPRRNGRGTPRSPPASASGSSRGAALRPRRSRSRRAPSRPRAPGPGRRSRPASRAAAPPAAGWSLGGYEARVMPQLAGDGRCTDGRRRPGSAPAARARPGWSGRRGSRAACAAATASARGSRSGRRRRCPRAGSRRRRPRSSSGIRERSIVLPCSRAICSTQSSTAESIPSPSRSIFRKPASAHESLSHWQIWLPSIAAGWTGTSSTSGRVEITIPPGCCEIWRGRPPISPQSRANARQRGECELGVGVRQLRQLLADAVRVAVGEPGEPLELGERQAERLADVADRPARVVGREARDERRVLAAVALADRDDQLLADVAREVEVDVGHRHELAVEEAAEREPGVHRVDVREAGQVADDRADRAAAPRPGGRTLRATEPPRTSSAHSRASSSTSQWSRKNPARPSSSISFSSSSKALTRSCAFVNVSWNA